MYPHLIVQKAEDLYVLDQKSLREISDILDVSDYTLSKWKKKYKWEEKRDVYLTYIPKCMNTTDPSQVQSKDEKVQDEKVLKAYKRQEIINNAPVYDGPALSEYLKKHGIPRSTFCNWKKKYREEGLGGLVDNRGRVKRQTKMDNLKYILDMVYETGKSKKELMRDFIAICNAKGVAPPSYWSIRRLIDKNYSSRDIVAEEMKSGPILLNQYRSIGVHSFLPTGIHEIDRVLGGGFHIPSSVVLAGDPGVGKSTLMLQVMSNIAETKGIRNGLYISAEQDISQIKKRMNEIGVYDKFFIDDTTDSLEHIIQIIREMHPKFVVVDSIKRIRTSSYTGTYDSPYYVSYCGKQLTRLSKEARSSIVLINHMTKKGDMSGLKSFEHDVDVVLYLQGNPLSNTKVLYASKNRYGDTSEVGFFRMTEKGLVEVNDIEYLFRQRRNRKVFGVSLVVIHKGQRILPLEIQSLTSEPIGKPRINVTGLDKEQVIKILMIIKEKLSIDLTDKEITMTTTGEVEANYPYIQLAIFSALMSNTKRVDMSKNVFIGEVDLTGSVRPFYGQKKLLNSILGVKDIKEIYAPRPADPIEYLENARITYVDDIYSLSESVFKL